LIGFLIGILFSVVVGFYVFHTFVNYEVLDDKNIEIPKSEVVFPKSATPSANLISGSAEDLNQ